MNFHWEESCGLLELTVTQKNCFISNCLGFFVTIIVLKNSVSFKNPCLLKSFSINFPASFCSFIKTAFQSWIQLFFEKTPGVFCFVCVLYGTELEESSLKTRAFSPCALFYWWMFTLQLLKCIVFFLFF